MAFTAKLPSTVPKTKVVAGESRIRLSSPAFPIQPAVSVQEIKGFGVTEIANNQSITYNAITNQFEPIDVSSVLERASSPIRGGQF